MELIEKDALVAEIDRRINKYILLQQKPEMSDLQKELQNKIDCLNSIKGYIINTLEVKEVDLEKKATQLSQKYFPDEENIWARPNIEAHKCKSACIEMIEWLKAQKGE